ncbi:unnamed protein product [Closterium sp. NIES-65]|nr:unnamed protein product [Closterium sp. NIES-65]
MARFEAVRLPSAGQGLSFARSLVDCCHSVEADLLLIPAHDCSALLPFLPSLPLSSASPISAFPPSSVSSASAATAKAFASADSRMRRVASFCSENAPCPVTLIGRVSSFQASASGRESCGGSARDCPAGKDNDVLTTVGSSWQSYLFVALGASTFSSPVVLAMAFLRFLVVFLLALLIAHATHAFSVFGVSSKATDPVGGVPVDEPPLSQSANPDEPEPRTVAAGVSHLVGTTEGSEEENEGSWTDWVSGVTGMGKRSPSEAQAEEKWSEAADAGGESASKAGQSAAKSGDAAEKHAEAGANAASDAVTSAWEKLKQAATGAASAGREGAEQVGEAGAEAQRRAGEAGARLGERAGETGAQAQQRAEEYADAMAEGAGATLEGTKAGGQRAAEEAGKAGWGVYDRMRSVADQLQHAAGQGMGVGWDIVGQTRDTAASAGAEAGERAKAGATAAEETAEGLTQRAGERAADVASTAEAGREVAEEGAERATGAVGSAVGRVVDGVRDTVSRIGEAANQAGQAGEFAAGTVKQAGAGAHSAGKGAYDTAAGAAGRVGEGVSGAGQFAADQAKAAGSKAYDAASGAAAAIPGPADFQRAGKVMMEWWLRLVAKRKDEAEEAARKAQGAAEKGSGKNADWLKQLAEAASSRYEAAKEALSFATGEVGELRRPGGADEGEDVLRDMYNRAEASMHELWNAANDATESAKSRSGDQAEGVKKEAWRRYEEAKKGFEQIQTQFGDLFEKMGMKGEKGEGKAEKIRQRVAHPSPGDALRVEL